MEWKFIKNLTNADSYIDEAEEKFRITFPKEYRDIVKVYNGGRPRPGIIKLKDNFELIVDSFNSLNKNDRENIYNVNNIDSNFFKQKYVAFAMDPFGNLFGFYRNSSDIGYYNHDKNQVKIIARDFNEFMSLLEK
ncbi:SMI1/KNR4 family protein [Ligilactobacillus equi]|uniref:Knr4/Smi1-like domain-containing protein n=1 Tax=Ligilactobacillus equi DSM 15833 = JCM 10991 TaxID=1423740 RepID=A0A0R1TNZ4_9LACO|nr:SMI1/KNR4 family protein [Ligilactobacillus equi]KRL83169.1 hypothetical protein FC36_GL000736 [Ligilactobacillus equi DSM 15833 = JCM 10991]